MYFILIYVLTLFRDAISVPQMHLQVIFQSVVAESMK